MLWGKDFISYIEYGFIDFMLMFLNNCGFIRSCKNSKQMFFFVYLIFLYDYIFKLWGLIINGLYNLMWLF